MSEVRRARARGRGREDRGREGTEVRGRMADVRGREGTEVGKGQKSDVRDQRADVGSQESLTSDT